MPFGEGYRPKPPEELSKQLESTQAVLGAEAEDSLVPESQDKEKILQMSESELKQKFARRYEMYLQLLRDQKRQEKTGESNLPPKDIEDMKKWLGVLNSLDEYIIKHHGGEQTLRGRQINVFEDLKQFMEDGDKRGYIKFPTGVGKTVLFTEFTEALDLKTLIVVPKKILVKQTADKMKRFAPDMEYGMVYSKAKEYGRQVTIITYDSLLLKIESGEINPDDFDAVILDEAHKVLGEQRKDALEKFDKQLIVGFSATPDYSEVKKLSNVLPKKIHEMTVREAVEENLLCSVSSIVVHTEADLSTVEINKGEYSEKQLEDAVNIESRNQAAVKIYKSQFEGQAALAYCVGIKHAEKVAAEFNKAGVPAAAINGKTKSKAQDKILEQFKNGEIKVLCNAALLIEGFDEPEASVCLNLCPTLSRVDAEQRGGRVLRVDENNSKKHATVVDFLDKGISEANLPILFADVVDGAVFLPREEWGGSKGGGRGKDENPSVFIEIPGLEVTYDAQEVMKLVARMREDKENNKKEGFKFRTEASAFLELEEAFAKWQSLSKSKGYKLKFNSKWLEHNGYENLIVWCRRNVSLQDLVKNSGNELLKKSFIKQEIKKGRTVESAILELEEAFAKWQSMSEPNIGKFNYNWLENNGYGGLCIWSRNNVSLEKLVVMSKKDDLKENFKKREMVEPKKRTVESAILELEEAFAKWVILAKAYGLKFNTRWLSLNGYKNLVGWSENNVSLTNLVAKSTNNDLKESFEKTEKRNAESALKELEEAFAKWQSLPNESKGNFGVRWLRDKANGYTNLYMWSFRNISIADLVAMSSNENLKKLFVV